MKSLSAIFFCSFLFLSSIYGFEPARSNAQPATDDSPHLQALLDRIIQDTFKEFASEKLKKDELAATILDLTDEKNILAADYRGGEKIYPASVVKMFYMVALHRWLEDGKVKNTPELERGLRDMIGVSSNDATGYILDVLTGTGGGPELSAAELTEYAFKKNAVNRYFRSLGFDDINVNQKTYCEDIYGRERQFWNGGEQRNKLTTNSTARLLSEIARGSAVTPERSRSMLEQMRRDPFSKTDDPEDQAHGFTGIGLVELGLKSAKLFSKAGYTSSTRHDAAYLELPNGKKLVIVIFTENHADERNIIAKIAGDVLRELSKNQP